MTAERDPLADREAEAAAREAASIGGEVPESERDLDPAQRAVRDAGGGEAEGFEQSEEELERHATHADDRLSPRRDAFTPEQESDRSTAVYGEPDEEDVSEVVSDPREGPEDPGAGPGIAQDR